jgi:UTP:GlnB (protein PII) uridylyltransferase
MDSIGLLTQIFPELEAGRQVAKSYYGKGGVVRHSLDTVSNFEWMMDHLAKPSQLFDQKMIEQIWPYLNELQGGFRRHAFLKLGALLHDVGKPATAQRLNGLLRFFAHEEVGAKLVGPRFRSLRFSRQEDKTMTGWVRHHMRLGNLAAAAQITDKAVVRFWRDLEQDGIGMILLSLADHYDYLSKRLWMKATDPVEKMAKRLLEKYLFLTNKERFDEVKTSAV